MITFRLIPLKDFLKPYNPTPPQENEIENEKILALKDSNPHQNTTNLESQIDKLVYSLYNLTPKKLQSLRKNNE